MVEEWTEEKLFQYYQYNFKPIYADLVAVTADKPFQISFETEAMLSHIGVAKTQTDPRIIKSNIFKAGGHLERASLDAAKILWLVYRKRLQPILEDDLIKKYCTLVPEREFIAKYNYAESLALQARKTEIENVGISPRESVTQYYEAASEFRNLLDLVDEGRIESIRKFKLVYMFKQHSAGLAAGLISSAIIAVLAWKFLPTPPSVLAAEKTPATVAAPSK